MALEDVVHAGVGCMSIEQAAEALKKNNETAGLKGYLGYVSRIESKKLIRGWNLKTMKDYFIDHPGRLKEAVEEAKPEAEKSLVEAVSKNYDAIISQLPDEAVQTLAVEMPDKDKKYLDIVELIEGKKPEDLDGGDYKNLRKAYAETTDNREWLKCVLNMSNDFLFANVTGYIEDQKSAFLEQYAHEVERNGKKEYELDYGKLRGYLKDDKKYGNDKTRDKAYLITGKFFSQLALSSAKEASKASSGSKPKGGKGKKKK